MPVARQRLHANGNQNGAKICSMTRVARLVEAIETSTTKAKRDNGPARHGLNSHGIGLLSDRYSPCPIPSVSPGVCTAGRAVKYQSQYFVFQTPEGAQRGDDQLRKSSGRPRLRRERWNSWNLDGTESSVCHMRPEKRYPFQSE